MILIADEQGAIHVPLADDATARIVADGGVPFQPGQRIELADERIAALARALLPHTEVVVCEPA